MYAGRIARLTGFGFRQRGVVVDWDFSAAIFLADENVA